MDQIAQIRFYRFLDDVILAKRHVPVPPSGAMASDSTAIRILKMALMAIGSTKEIIGPTRLRTLLYVKQIL